MTCEQLTYQQIPKHSKMFTVTSTGTHVFHEEGPWKSHKRDERFNFRRVYRPKRRLEAGGEGTGVEGSSGMGKSVPICGNVKKW